VSLLNSVIQHCLDRLSRVSYFSLPLAVLAHTRGFRGMFIVAPVGARVNRLGVMNELYVSFHMLPSRADILCVEVFCSEYLLKTFRIPVSDASVTTSPATQRTRLQGPCPQPQVASGRLQPCIRPAFNPSGIGITWNSIETP